MDPKSTTASRYINRRTTLAALGFESYDDYLASPLWKRVRAAVMKAANGKCRLCRQPAYTAHHCDYTRQAILGTDLSRLIAICKPCHYRIEFEGGAKLLDTNSICQKTAAVCQRKRAKKRLKPKCRCCNQHRRSLGRNDICTDCHRKHRQTVHEVAAKNSL